jgi:murein DD-endopeptidase MepM/ murein hydrolase activator NlpD
MKILNRPIDSLKITSGFGMRLHPVDDGHRWHNGIDIGAPIGTPIYAVSTGVVKSSKVNNGGVNVGLGYYLVVEHDDYCCVYAHLKALGVPVGTKVKPGDIIGYTGNTGKSSGPHLHFEIRKGKFNSSFWSADRQGRYTNALDPKPFIDALKPETIESITARVARMGIISDTNLWVSYQKGTPVKAEHLQALFRKISESDRG